MIRRGLAVSSLAIALAMAGVVRAAPAAPAPAASASATIDLDEAPAPAPSASAAPAEATTPVAMTPGKPDTRGAAMRAYQTALAAQKLGATTPLSRDGVAEALAAAEQKLDEGRRDEAIGDLVFLVESPRFEPFHELDEGRNAVLLLGDALGRAGAYDPARAYLVPLLEKNPVDIWARRAARSLVDFGLDSDTPQVFIDDLKKMGAGVPDELAGDIWYLTGRTEQRAGHDDTALAALSRVSQRSRFWAQATYLQGLVHVGAGRLKQGEQQFCKVADVKQTPREALAFGGGDFFRVRDMARLGLGRVAHEQYRFDDARYYYYLVPNDSERLPEALYESANSRYEAKDYRGARDLLDEMRSRGEHSRYEDEFWVFDAYVDLALCQFPQADEKLRRFIKQYEPVRDAARRTASDPRALGDLVSTVQTGADPESLGTRGDAEPLRALGADLRADPDYGVATRRLAELDHELSGLRQSMAALDDAKTRLTSSKEVRPRADVLLGGTPAERAERLDAQLGEVRRLVHQVKASGGHAAEIEQLEEQLAALEARARDASQGERPVVGEAAGAPATLPDLVAADRTQSTALYANGDAMRGKLAESQRAAAKDALGRLDLRLSRLLRRARLGRIETVLGKKRALEIEIEALSEGYLPQGAVDSLEAARYLRDDEEYWPFDGEDWADEYVGGEGLDE
ncbi:MAG TPA: hypothetical protein VH062_30635 [Polyangiaceae bacterium]|nr:hypothetical protein [Polyangiaceae bacterium]